MRRGSVGTTPPRPPSPIPTSSVGQMRASVRVGSSVPLRSANRAGRRTLLSSRTRTCGRRWQGGGLRNEPPAPTGSPAISLHPRPPTRVGTGGLLAASPSPW